MDKNFALAMAIEKGKLAEVKAQLKEIDDVNKILKSGDALIHYAVLAESVTIVKLLIEAGCDVNIKDTYSHQTCLHYCGEYGYLDIAQLLIDNGADLSITDLYGNEPLWTVVTSLEKNDKKRLAVISLFLKSGGNKNHKNKAGVTPLDYAKEVKYKPLLDVLEN